MIGNNLVHVSPHHIAWGAVVTSEQSLHCASLAVLGHTTANLGKVRYIDILTGFSLGCLYPVCVSPD